MDVTGPVDAQTSGADGSETMWLLAAVLTTLRE